MHREVGRAKDLLAPLYNEMALLKAKSTLLRSDSHPKNRYIRHRLRLTRVQSFQETVSINTLTQPQLYLETISCISQTVLIVLDNGFLKKKKPKFVAGPGQ
jgi:hypothetical protein